MLPKMIETSYILAPVVGGVIGYITNDIAIRMLFRPHKAKHIFGIHIPFTPGIIPKEKGRIADAIGNVISENLMSPDVLQRYLLSDEILNKLQISIEKYISVQKSNDETVEEFLSHYLTSEEISVVKSSIGDNLAIQVESKIVDSALGERIARMAMDHVASKLNADGAKELLTGLGNILRGMAGAAAAIFGEELVGKFLEMLREPTERYLAKNINAILQNNGHEIVTNLVDEGIESFMTTSVSTHLADKDEQITQMVNAIMGLYKTIITEHLPKILKSVDVSKIVRDRINEMEVAETEKLIFQVMKKELKAIVWLGALLGMIMGCINIFR